MIVRFAFVLAVLAASPALAQPYTGGSVGRTTSRNACDGAAAGITCEDGDSALRLFVGYSFAPHFAVEFGYGTLGTFRASTGETVDLTAADLSLIGSWPISNRFSAHARLGVYAGTMEGNRGGVSSTDNTVPCPIAPPGVPQPACPPPASFPERGWQNGNNTDVTYGLGVSYAMTETGVLRLEWQRFQNLGGGSGPKIDVDLFSLGALVRFP